MDLRVVVYVLYKKITSINHWNYEKFYSYVVEKEQVIDTN